MTKISYPANQKLNLILTIIFSLSLIYHTVGQQARNPQFTNQNSQQVTYSQQAQAEISPTQKVRKQQRQALHKDTNSQFSLNSITQFGFEITNAYEQFHFHLPTDQTIYFYSRTYVLKNNAYTQIKDIADDPAVYLVVYENNHRIVAQKSFYFYSGISINGKAGSTYMLRFFSSTHKLLIVKHSNFLQTSQIQTKIKSSQLQQNQIKLKSLNNKLIQIFKNLRFTHGSQGAQRIYMTIRTDNFVKFQIVQIMLLAVVTLFQLKMISKLFKTQSIV